MQPPPLNQPFDLQIDTRVDKAVEVSICVFERQRVRIRKVGSDLQVKFSREVHERKLRARVDDLAVWGVRHA